MLSQQEKDNYKGAVASAMKSKEYFEFTKLHVDEMSERQAHKTCAFLIWHKRFLLAYENMLRAQGPQYACVTVPYWDTMGEYANMIDGKCSSIGECASIVQDFSNSPTPNTPDKEIDFFGYRLSGSCYPLFAGNSFCDDNKNCGCVPRNNLMEQQYPPACDFTGISNSIAYSKDFEEFTKALQTGIHNEVHNAVGGFMGQMTSPVDPIFWSWHTTIDMLLYSFHKCHVSRSMSEKDVRKSIYGFSQDGACKYDSNAPDAIIDGKIVQQSTRVAAQDNQLIGKYFKGLSDNIADYISFKGPLTYRYQLSDAMRVQLLQSEDMCPVFVEDMSKNTPAPTTPAPTTVRPTPTPTTTAESTPTPKPTTKAPPSGSTTPKPSSGGDNGSVTKAPPTSAPSTSSLDGSAGSVHPSDDESDGNVYSFFGKKHGKKDKNAKKNDKKSGKTNGKKYVDISVDGAVHGGDVNISSASAYSDKEIQVDIQWLDVDSRTFVEEQNSKYWDWYSQSREFLKEVLPGNIPEISIQMEALGCTCFENQFGIQNFTEDFKKNFMLNEKNDRPRCQRKIEQIEQGKIEMVLQAPAFEAKQVQVKPGVTPAPAMNPKEAYKKFHVTFGAKTDEANEDATKTKSGHSAAAAVTSASIHLSISMVVAAIAAYFTL